MTTAATAVAPRPPSRPRLLNWRRPSGHLPKDPARRYAPRVIVVIGSPLHRPGTRDRPSGAAGLAVGIAAASCVAGATVQLVGRVGEDPAGDATVLALSSLGIGHVAMLRDAARPTSVEPAGPTVDPDIVAESADAQADTLADRADETADAVDERSSLRPGDPATLDPDDIDLALHYLDGYRVIVVAEPISAAGLAVIADAAAFGGARLVVLVAEGDAPGPTASSDGATVFEAPPSDPEGVFARTVGAFAVALDQGADPANALEGALSAGGWERSTD